MKKKLLMTLMLSSIFFNTMVYADVQTNNTQLQQTINTGSTTQLSSIINSIVQSLIPYSAQVSIGDVKVKDNGDVVATNILIIGEGNGNLNYSINEIEVKGLDLNGTVNHDFSVDVDKLSATNLAATLVEQNAMPTEDKTKAIDGAAKNADITGAVLNDLGDSIANLTFAYDYDAKTIFINANITDNSKKLLVAKVEFNNVDLYDVQTSDLGGQLESAIGKGTIGNVNISGDLSGVLKQAFSTAIPSVKDTPTFKFNGSFNKESREFSISASGEYKGDEYLNYNFVAENVNLPDVAINKLSTNYADALNNAYIEKTNALIDINGRLSKNDFEDQAEAKQVFAILGKDNVDINLFVKDEYKDSKGSTEVKFKAKDLASISFEMENKVDGNLLLLPYMGLSVDNQSREAYDCNGVACLVSAEFEFENESLLQTVTKLVNNNPNTTPRQVLSSYGALAQLMAAQQKDPTIRNVLSAVAMFLQNPKSLEIKADAKKPVNQTVLTGLIIKDVNQIKVDGVAKSTQPQQSSKLSMLGNVDKYFDVHYYVNGSDINS